MSPGAHRHNTDRSDSGRAAWGGWVVTIVLTVGLAVLLVCGVLSHIWWVATLCLVTLAVAGGFNVWVTWRLRG